MDTKDARARRKRRKIEKPARLAARLVARREAGQDEMARARYIHSILVSHPALTPQQLGVSLTERLALEQLRQSFIKRPHARSEQRGQFRVVADPYQE